MNTPSIAKSIVAGMKGGGGKPGAPPKGISLGHVSAMEDFMEAVSERKPTEAAQALKAFFELCQAEYEGGEEE